ncbi:hypothetical protein SISSUDRAFT_1068609 [Sistotremastrum suecicum HHB10207 ss-3]|uniref:TATA-binding protein-associated factor mot1 n=1 Tax=Sistotremastrum suecicum HHB10207 ss-3 TaxID=1314776 RepID=A0A166IY56_9AGAM|nr:hypothetical protein SISSUDRAFT_1068609 [Sistotremastrum suecicum HHB10207 ss-3]
MTVIARILPCLRSKSFDTRIAAASAISNICNMVPTWTVHYSSEKLLDEEPLEPPSFPSFDLPHLIHATPTLVASSGQEFTKPTSLNSSNDVRRARKEAMGRLGLDFLDGVGGDDGGMDWEKELADQTPGSDTMFTPDPPEPVKMEVEHDVLENHHNSQNGSKVNSPTPEPVATAGLSARELNRLKRKRKAGPSAFVSAPPPTAGQSARYNSVAAGPSNNKARLLNPTSENKSRVSPPSSTPPNASSPDKVVVDPSKGGQVEAKQKQHASAALQVHEGVWVWDGLVRVLEVDLFDSSWQIRHGAAGALRDILKAQGLSGGMKRGKTKAENSWAHEQWCNDLAGKILCVLVLDRFCDFSRDQSVSPVRETMAQTLASLLIHMPRRAILHVHDVLLQMITQDTKRSPGQQYVWQVRHAGMLGLKYEVAVRQDLIIDHGETKPETDPIKNESTPETTNGHIEEGAQILSSVVTAAILGLGDADDDVRSVAASMLLPVAKDLVRVLPDDIPRVLDVLWSCLANMKDDLSSSVGAVMDLLGQLVNFPLVTDILADPAKSRPLVELAPTLFSFFRHTISNVRLAVVTTLKAFLTVPNLPKDWVSSAFLWLLLQNIMLEEKPEIREVTLDTWKIATKTLASVPYLLEATVLHNIVSEWWGLVMQPWGIPLNPSLFYRISKPLHENADVNAESHNVDKAMMDQDLSLVSPELIMQNRIAAATALGYLLYLWPSEVGCNTLFGNLLSYYSKANSALQRTLLGIVVEEWAQEAMDSKVWPVTSPIAVEGGAEAVEPPPRSLEGYPILAGTAANLLLEALQLDPPSWYSEGVPPLKQLLAECVALLRAFVTDGKMSESRIPAIPMEITMSPEHADGFTLSVAERVVGPLYTELKTGLAKPKKKDLLAIEAKRATAMASIDNYRRVKEHLDVRTTACVAAAAVALKVKPEKIGTVIKAVMNGVKFEDNVDLQTRFATALAHLMDIGLNEWNSVGAMAKVVKNLCAFLCSDTAETPSFAPSKGTREGILSFKRQTEFVKPKAEEPETPEKSKASISRRGAQLSLNQMSQRFGNKLFDSVPMTWESTVDGLMSTCDCREPKEADKTMEKQTGQDVIDSLVIIQNLVPSLHPDLWPRIAKLYPALVVALRSQFAIVRQSSARCFSTICDIVIVDSMRFVIENVLPLIGDPLSLSNRQGAVELIFHIVQKLDIKALPYVIFLVIPILGRMSDADLDIRATATNTFASLVKMVPLEAGLPDPEGFPAELLKRRDEERQFLAQLLDGSKMEPYSIPVTIKAELRKYQQDGVNWLAFLAKYQLHGILCDDMGLGKTLQSICILASKHHERAEAHKETKSPDTSHLPSLIVCPPTLTGHWYYEILKYTENLKPVMYVGSSRERAKLLSSLRNKDVVITSYEVVRNDINNLVKIDWLYCVLDEGHIIKNGKTKLTKAVKTLKSQHRLVLSGTPIQNNVLELWSLFDFLMPGFLGTEASFNERFGKPILSNREGKGNAKTSEAANLALEALHKQVLPFLLRRLKEDVLSDLPPKIIQDYYCDLSDLQKQLYEDFTQSHAHQEAQEVVNSEGSKGKGQQHIFQSLQYLRKLCNHPALVLKEDGAAERVLAKFRNKHSNAAPLRDLQHAPKLQALRQLLLDCGIGGSPIASTEGVKSESSDLDNASGDVGFSQHRVLIFCQLKQMLDIIETDLFKNQMPSVTYMRLDGSTDPNKRHAIVQTFNGDPSIDCLLLTTHVGGLGLTLTGADTVIFVEHDWNPMKDLQAMDRAHRIGQKKVVNVYRLITKGTLEEKIMGLQRFKLNIANSVITQQNSGLASMETDLVLDLFKCTTEEEDAAAASKKRKEAQLEKNPGRKSVLDGLEDLPPAEEYEGLDLQSFLAN